MFSLGELNENLSYVGNSLLNSLTDDSDATYAVVGSLENQQFALFNSEIASEGCIVSGNSNQNSVKNLFAIGGVLCGGG